MNYVPPTLPFVPVQVVLDARGVSTSSGNGLKINWTLLSSLAKNAALALAVDDAPTSPPPAAAAGNSTSIASATDVATPEEYRLAGLTSFAFAAAVPGPTAALSLGKARATAAGGGGDAGSALSTTAAAAATGGSMAAARGPSGKGVCASLAAVLGGVRLVREGLAGKLCVKGGEGGGGDGGVVVEEFVIRCGMTGPQAEVYSAVAR